MTGTARPLILDLMQMLRDRTDPDGYAEQMTNDPLSDTPRPPRGDGRRLRRPPGH
jgi:hypothetical protein